MSYEGGYPTVLKKLFPPYWRLLVHMFLQCIAENKGGFDQLNKTQTSALVALMLEDLKKKIFMLYPRFIQMILDEKHPEFVKGPNYVNLKPMGQDASKMPIDSREPSSITSLENFHLRSMEDLATSCQFEVEVVASEKVEKNVRQPNLMTAENLAALLKKLQSGEVNPPSAPTSEAQVEGEAEAEAITDNVEQASNKKQRTGTTPDPDFADPISDPEPTMSTNPNSATAATKETSTQEPEFDFDFDFESTPSHPESSSGVRFEA
ncbi:hypothetical protein Hanom_Chr08g00731311 [Helianthus anomalus]